jgi:uncharacterized protein involved in high-affinity Fe2+ transport
VLNSDEFALSVSVCVTESSFLTVTTAPGETVIESGENMKFLMTTVSLLAVFWPAGDPVAVAPVAVAPVAVAPVDVAPVDPVAPVAEGVLELLLEQAVSAKARMSPGTHSHLR